MVDLKNFAIKVTNSNANKIIDYLKEKTPIDIGVNSGTASNGSYYFINELRENLGCDGYLSERVKNSPIYTLEEFIEQYENHVKTHELW